MKLYESIKKHLKESDDVSYINSVLQSLNSSTAKELYDYGFKDFLMETLDSDDYSQYSDYAMEANSVSEVSWALKELKKIFKEKLKDAQKSDKNKASFLSKTKKYIDDLQEFINTLTPTSPWGNSGFSFNLTKLGQKLTKAFTAKEDELLKLRSTYGHAAYRGDIFGYFDIRDDSYDDNTQTFGYLFNINFSYPLTDYVATKDVFKFIRYDSSLSLDELSKTMTTLIPEIKKSFEDLFLSFDPSDYEKFLDSQIALYKNKIQKRNDRNNAKEKALSQDVNSIKLSRQDVINIISKQSPKLSSDVFDANFGSLYIKGTLPNGYKTSITVKLYGGKNPGEFEFGIADVTRNQDFVEYCTKELVSGLGATKTEDRKEPSRLVHCYSAPTDNLSKLPGIIDKLNSELIK